ncbi:MAG TPA: PilZ domain-containing protein [Candidatus Acidoferrales bacterium]|nr:PilZ domain-containing protein [Candidatus Acidoferrales bacterium]
MLNIPWRRLVPRMPEELKKKDNPSRLSERERRSSIRYPFSAAADATDIASGARVASRCSDLGRGGCFVDSINPFPVGTAVSVRLTTDQNTFESRAEVVYAMPGMGMGLAFVSVEPEQLWVLESWLAKLSGRSVHEMKAPEPIHATGPIENSSPEPGYVLNELIITLMRKRVLTEAEGKALLKKLAS